MPKFGLKMNSGRSNVKLRGQMMMKFYDFAIHLIFESSDSNLRSGRNTCFKINKNPNQIWAKMKSKTTVKAKLTA